MEGKGQRHPWVWKAERTQAVCLVPALMLDGRPGGRVGASAEMDLERSPLTFLRTCCSLAEWAFTCLRRELGSV